MKGLCALVVCGGLVAVEGVERSDAGVLRGTEEAVKQIAQGRRQLQAGGGLRPMGTRAAKIGCYENFGWAETTDPEQVVPPEPAFLFGSTDGVDRSSWVPPRESITATAADPLVHQCMRGCLGLDYDYFGVYNGVDCMCGTGPPTTASSLACEPCEVDLDGYECGAVGAISVYRDFNRVWEEPRYENYHAPPPPDMPAIHDGQYALTDEEMAQLFAKLDKDHDGAVAVNEMVDVFDLVENGALTVRDCQGNMYPHRWIGDGFCDDGTETEDGSPDFNCATFECDRNDCATGCVASPEHDRVSIVPDTLTAANFGEIAKMGEVWWSKFEAVAGETYTFVGQTGNQAQDLVPGADGTWLTVAVKDGTSEDSTLAELDLTTPGSIVATDPCSSPHCTGTATDSSMTCDLDPLTDGTAECPDGCDGDNWHGTDPCPIVNTWTNTGESRTVYLETRVRRSDGVCAFGADSSGQVPDDIVSPTSGIATPTVETVTTSLTGYTTYRVSASLDQSVALNVYSAFATLATSAFGQVEMVVSAAYQQAAPFGADYGGVNPAFFDLAEGAEFDSWLTLGKTEGDDAGDLSSIGIDWASWTIDAPLDVEDGALFWMSPDDAPAGDAVVAQLTFPVGSTGNLAMGLQGRPVDPNEPDWQTVFECVDVANGCGDSQGRRLQSTAPGLTASAVDHRGHCFVSVIDPAAGSEGDGGLTGFSFEEARGHCESAGMTLASIRAPDQESFVETHLLRDALTAKYWIGAAKEPGASWNWLDGLRFFWDDWETGQGEDDTAACGALNHDSTHALDGWTSEDCTALMPGFICLKDTELSVPEATGLFKLLVTTADGEAAEPEEPPLWSTVLWARSGYNSTVAAQNGVFADGPSYVAPAECVNLLDEQNGNATQCQIMQEYGFDCLTYFCPNCEYAGYCDLACDFCGDEIFLPSVEEPREELVIPEPEPEPWIDEDDPSCFDSYDLQGGSSASHTPNQCDYYRASEPDYVPEYENGALVGDAALCQLGPNDLVDGTVCESQMRSDAPGQPACIYTPAPVATSQCDLMLQSGFECATWMCRDADVCPYSGFCDRTCGYCMRADGYPCTPLSAMEGYFAQRAQTGNENCIGGACSVDGCTSLPYCEVDTCDVAWGDAQTNPNTSTCRECITGAGDCPSDCVCDPACDAAPIGAWCLADVECESSNCDESTTTCAP